MFYRITFEIIQEKREIMDVFSYETTFKMVEIIIAQGFKLISIIALEPKSDILRDC